MGFMDKAKKLAEQAQEKLDEAQKNFNKNDSPQAERAQGPRYDEHGRPIPEETPAAATAPPSATPPETPVDPPAADPPAGDANASPDPFKPIQ